MAKSAAPATPQKLRKASRRRPSPVVPEKGDSGRLRETDLVILTGMSGSGKGSVLKAFEDLGYYCVDNLPVDLIPKFAELCRSSREMRRTALVVDIREGTALKRFPAIYRQLRRRFRRETRALLIFLEASDEALGRRFSETRRPHPLLKGRSLREGIAAERKLLHEITSDRSAAAPENCSVMWRRRSCTLKRLVSSTRSAISRIGISSFRSASIPSRSDRPLRSGCGRRVSLNRRPSTSSLASRKISSARVSRRNR